MSFALASLAKTSAGRLVGGDCAFDTVSTDSRTLTPGALFVALTGANFDGHVFAAAAAERGAAAALVARELPLPIPQAIVPDPLAALSTFAREWRRSMRIPVVGVTGSNGKTTAKEMLGAILSRLGPCLVTQGNLNNHIGVPLTLLRLTGSHRTAVIEMGANHRGEIAGLCAIAEPTVGLVTNAAAAHLEGFGSLDGVAQGKGELFQALPADGTAAINVDDKYAPLWRQLSAARRTVTFGFDIAADFRATNISESTTSEGFASAFDLVTQAGTRAIKLNLGGEHNVRNALGAAATAHAAGANLDDIAAGLASVQAVAGRLQLKPASNGAFVVDDSYNANPGSLKAGLDAFKPLADKRWLVLGDMRELGPDADRLHAEIGRYAHGQAGIERLLAVGTHTPHAVHAFGDGARWYADVDSLVADLKSTLTPGVAVLVKGSRVNRLERVVEALTGAKAAGVH